MSILSLQRQQGIVCCPWPNVFGHSAPGLQVQDCLFREHLCVLNDEMFQSRLGKGQTPQDEQKKQIFKISTYS